MLGCADSKVLYVGASAAALRCIRRVSQDESHGRFPHRDGLDPDPAGFPGVSGISPPPRKQDWTRAQSQRFMELSTEDGRVPWLRVSRQHEHVQPAAALAALF